MADTIDKTREIEQSAFHSSASEPVGAHRGGGQAVNPGYVLFAIGAAGLLLSILTVDPPRATALAPGGAGACPVHAANGAAPCR